MVSAKQRRGQRRRLLKTISIGMALRMALDLGLNRNADNWTEHGQPLFSPVEKQTRKQIWWCCCITDKCVARPSVFYASY